MRRLTLVALVLASVGVGLGVLAVLPLMLMSPMVFDAPGSAGAPLPLLFMAGLFSFPPLALYGLVRAWRTHRGGDDRGALLCLLIPTLAVGLAFAAIQLLPHICPNDGELGCN